MEKYIHSLITLSFLISSCYVLSSCCDDEEDKKEDNVEVKRDDKSGHFWLKNLRTKEGAGMSIANKDDGAISYIEINKIIECEQGDTLIVKFTPKSDYSEDKFKFRPDNILDNASHVGDTVLTSNLALGEHTLVAKSVCQIEGYELSSEYSFSFNVNRKKVFDSEAGTFSITNISTREAVNGLSYNCFAGDTLEVLFKPKKEYASVPFEIKGGSFTKLNDSLFVVPDLKTSMGNGIDIGKTVNFQTVYNENDSILMCKYEFSLITFVEEADVTYTLYVTPDLLQFVSASLSYTDDNGQELTFSLKDEDWTTETIEMDGESVELTCYRLPLHYNHLDCDHTVKAIYSIEDGVALTKESYDFDHSLNWGSAIVAGAPHSSVSININIGGDGMIKADDVAKYLQHLTDNPDVVKVHLGKRDLSIVTVK